jgi:hypothetical protein
MEQLMVAVLQDMQFDLEGYVFGNGLPVFIDQEGFDPGESVEILQDGTNPITGARLWGRDMRGAKTWTFSCHIDKEDVAGALQALEDMGSVWLAEKWLDPGNIAMLRYAIAGRTRVVFGKPRRFSHAIGNNVLQGTLPPVATFDLADSKHYADTEQIVDLQISPTLPGGFAVPFTAPLVIELPADAVRVGAMTVGGNASTAPVIEFTGPLTDGSVTIGTAIEVGFVGTIPAGRTIRIDTRPWSQAITRVGGGGVGVTLSRKTRLARSLVGPGSYEAIMRGVDATGTARCRVRWRNAYTTL